MALPRILVVEDEPHMARTLEFLLQDRNQVTTCSTGMEGLERFKSKEFDLAILDINLPDIDGIQILRQIKEMKPATEAIMVTARKDVRTAVEAMKLGAYDYIQKPFEKEDLLIAVERSLEKWRLSRQIDYLHNEVRKPYGFENIIARSRGMQEVFDLAQRAAQAETNVLISGETGTGKELVARAIHFAGPRTKGPFVAFNCARYSDTLIESELFGHEAGAFTGAAKTHRGKFEQANGGTLFLDEVGLTPAPTQARLLRVLEDRKIERVGGEEGFEVDVRIIAATNADLEGMIAEGTFREDLYYRLKVLRIPLPALRDRIEDVPLLAEYFVKSSCEKTGRSPKSLDADALKLLRAYDWPGNVRELQNLIETLVLTVDSNVLQSPHIAKVLISRVARSPQDFASLPATGSYEERINAFERNLLQNALDRNRWNKSRTATELGWHRNTLEYKIRKLGILRGDNGSE